MNIDPITDDFDDDTPISPDKPRVVFQSPYRLSVPQENALVEEAMQRLEDLEKELGRDLVGNMDWCSSASTDQVHAGSKTFLGRRQLYELTYHNEVEWRAQILGGIFEESNWVVPISRRIVSHQVARANSHFFGSDPYFSADIQAVGVDPDLKKTAERWVRSKFADAGVQAVLEGATESAFIRGESVVKRGHRKQEDLFEAEMEILIDATTNEPVLDSRGEYITRDRRRRIIQEVVENSGVTRLMPAPPAMTTRDVEIVEDDPGTILPPRTAQKYETRIVPRRQVLYSGPYAEECYFKDILIPLTAKDIDSASTVCHCYDTSVVELADQWRRESAGLGEAERNVDTQNAVRAIMAMRGNRSSQEVGSQSLEAGATSLYRTELPEDQAGYHGQVITQPEHASAKVVEFWMRHDANGDGILENILLVLDRESRTPIFYDYLANVTPDGKRPFSVQRINPISGRWYGVGSMQAFDMIQRIADLQMNRWNFAQGSSGRVTFFNRHTIVGGETDKELELNWGETYELKEGFTAADAISYVTLPEVRGEDLKLMLDFYLQMAHSMSGVQQPNDVGVQASEASKTATSIIQMTNAGQEMFGQLLSHLTPGITDAVNGLAEIAIVRMEENDPYSWSDGEQQQFALFDRSLVGEYRLRLRLLLSKFKAEQEKVALNQGLDRAVEFYTLIPEAQVRLAKMYQAFLRALDFPNVDELIVPSGMLPPPGGDPGFDATTTPYGDPSTRSDPAAFSGQMEGGMAGGIAAAGGAATA